MSVITIAILLFALIAAPLFWLLRLYQKRKRQKATRLFLGLSRMGTVYNMRFSSIDQLENCTIGLDGIHCRLLVLTYSGGGKIKHSRVIDLAEITSCKCRTIYCVRRSVLLCRSKTYLASLTLEFERNSRPTVEVLFYHYRSCRRSQKVSLYKKALHWEAMLNKMLWREEQKIA